MSPISPNRVHTLKHDPTLSSGGSDGKEYACNTGDLGLIPGLGRFPWRRAHSSILAWRIPWTEKPGGLRSMWSQRVRKTEWLTLSFYLDGLQGSVNVWNRLHTFVYVNNLVSEHQVCKWSLSKSQRKLPLEQLKAYILKSWISSNSMTLIMNKSLHYFTSSSPYL